VKNDKFIRLAAVALSALLIAVGCGLSHSSPVTTVEQPGAETVNPMEITLTESLRERIKIGEPAMSAVSSTLSVPARIEVDRRRAVRVGAQVAGRVTQVFVHEGDSVTQGQLLADIHSPQLSETQAAFLKASTRQQLARKAVERAQQLLQANVIGIAELQRREGELAEASAEVSAGRDQLTLLGMSEETIAGIEQTRTMNPVTRMVAIMSGTVLERNVTAGQVVQTSDTGFMIADLANVWLVADVPEQSAGNIHVGLGVEAQIPALPGPLIRGTLSFVSPIVNRETRTVSIRMDLPNPRGLYKPEMLATMTLQAESSQRVMVPSSAVVRENDSEHVFVQVTENKFVLRKVGLGDEFKSGRVLLDGLRTGEKIVLDGAFHLNNERRRLAVRNGEGG